MSFVVCVIADQFSAIASDGLALKPDKKQHFVPFGNQYSKFQMMDQNIAVGATGSFWHQQKLFKVCRKMCRKYRYDSSLFQILTEKIPDVVRRLEEMESSEMKFDGENLGGVRPLLIGYDRSKGRVRVIDFVDSSGTDGSKLQDPGTSPQERLAPGIQVIGYPKAVKFFLQKLGGDIDTVRVKVASLSRSGAVRMARNLIQEAIVKFPELVGGKIFSHVIG